MTDGSMSVQTAYKYNGFSHYINDNMHAYVVKGTFQRNTPGTIFTSTFRAITKQNSLESYIIDNHVRKNISGDMFHG